METKKYMLGFVAVMIAGAAVVMTACADAPQRTEDRLAEVEKQLIEERGNTALAEERGKTALAEERLEETNRLLLEALLAQESAVLAKEGAERAADAAHERVRASMAGQEEARARYECNLKIAGVWTILGHLVAEYGWDSDSLAADEWDQIVARLAEDEEPMWLMVKWWGDGDWVAPSDADSNLMVQEALATMIEDIEDGDC